MTRRRSLAVGTAPGRGSIGVRVVVVVLLVLALIDPPLSLRDAPVDVVVVLDASDSMPPAADVWPAVADRLAALPTGSRWSLVRYGARATLERDWTDVVHARAYPATKRKALVDATRSHTESGVIAGLAKTTADRASSVLLVTDGGGATASLADRLAAARRAGMPVQWLRVAPRPDPALRLGTVATPALAAAGGPLTLRVPVYGGLPARAEVRIDIDGQPVLRRALTAADGPVLRLALRAPPAGIHRVNVALAAPTGEMLAQSDGVLHVSGAVDALVVGDPASPVADLFEGAGLSITRATPDDVYGRLGADTARFGLLVLDDVSATDLDASATTRLAAAVTRNGAGLLTLGGPNSFGAGAYRHSSLEALLPVLSEAREPLPPAAVLFVVDTSGSMGRSDSGPTRLGMARRAVVDTGRGLAATDAVGLIAFDVEPTVALPLAPRDAPADALDAAWPAGAGGGTRLAPALARAVDLLAAVDAQQRLLVLVTDGFVEETLPPDVPERLRDAGVDVIALPVGTDAPSALLAALASDGDGRVLPVTDSALLPTLMRSEVAARRAASVTGPRLVVNAATDGWLPGAGAWPTVDGYMVTRPKAGARVLLTAPAGDPLLAVLPVGAGLSAAFPAGLGSAWATDWRRWEGLVTFLGELAPWLAGQPTGAALYLDVVPAGEAGSDAPTARVDLVDATGDWRSDAMPELTLRTPAGHAVVLNPVPVAPGRVEAPLPVTLEGLYVVSARWQDESLVRGYLHRPLGERADAIRGAERFVTWLGDGLLARADTWQFREAVNQHGLSVRGVLLLAALLLYVAVLIGDRRQALVHLGRARATRRRGARHAPRGLRAGVRSAAVSADPAEPIDRNGIERKTG